MGCVHVNIMGSGRADETRLEAVARMTGRARRQQRKRARVWYYHPFKKRWIRREYIPLSESFGAQLYRHTKIDWSRAEPL